MSMMGSALVYGWSLPLRGMSWIMQISVRISLLDRVESRKALHETFMLGIDCMRAHI